MFNIQNSFQRKKLKNYPYWFWCIDMHGTLFKNNYVEGSFGGAFYEDCRKPLQFLSNREDTKLILWTSSHAPVIENARAQLRKEKIFFDYVNENPVITNDALCDFSQKMYFDVLLDDKAGFNAEWHWKAIDNILYNMFGNEYQGN